MFSISNKKYVVLEAVKGTYMLLLILEDEATIPLIAYISLRAHITVYA